MYFSSLPSSAAKHTVCCPSYTPTSSPGLMGEAGGLAAVTHLALPFQLQNWYPPLLTAALSITAEHAPLEPLHGYQPLALGLCSPAHLPADRGACQCTSPDSLCCTHRCAGASWSKVTPLPTYQREVWEPAWTRWLITLFDHRDPPWGVFLYHAECEVGLRYDWQGDMKLTGSSTSTVFSPRWVSRSRRQEEAGKLKGLLHKTSRDAV